MSLGSQTDFLENLLARISGSSGGNLRATVPDSYPDRLEAILREQHGSALPESHYGQAIN